MRVKDLRLELESRGLEVTGIRPVLQARLGEGKSRPRVRTKREGTYHFLFFVFILRQARTNVPCCSFLARLGLQSRSGDRSFGIKVRFKFPDTGVLNGYNLFWGLERENKCD